MNDSQLIKIVIREIEKKLDWKEKASWKDYDYKRLSQLINESTNISIGPQTLKRLFGKVKYKEDFNLQPATKDAFARFLKYNDWDSFVRDQNIPKKPTASFPEKKIPVRIISGIVVAIIAAFFVIIVALLPKERTEEVIFFTDSVPGKIPYTVSFNYDISKIKNKDVYIDFDQTEIEDTSRGELLDKQRSIINYCFMSAGFFNVSISADGKKLASAKVHALSDGWESHYFINDNFILRKFVFGLKEKVLDTINDDFLYISPQELNKQSFNGNKIYYLQHILYQEFGVSADSCIMEVRYKNSPDMGGISCYDSEFRIICENGIASANLVQEGCHRWSEITIGETHLNGKYDDLSSLKADRSEWNVYKIKIENQTAEITNGDNVVFSGSFNNSLGQVKGIRFVTKGSGAFDYVKLYNLSGELKYYNDF
jgi:hypothetical protein